MDTLIFVSLLDIIPVIPVIPIIPISQHHEFYKSAWFARWKYEILLVHKQLQGHLVL